LLDFVGQKRFKRMADVGSHGGASPKKRGE
jgi:hypothetical protein